MWTELGEAHLGRYDSVQQLNKGEQASQTQLEIIENCQPYRTTQPLPECRKGRRPILYVFCCFKISGLGKMHCLCSIRHMNLAPISCRHNIWKKHILCFHAVAVVFLFLDVLKKQNSIREGQKNTWHLYEGVYCCNKVATNSPNAGWHQLERACACRVCIWNHEINLTWSDQCDRTSQWGRGSDRN